MPKNWIMLSNPQKVNNNFVVTFKKRIFAFRK